jgi:ABC-type nitrate/sulfonate/bicarbonate transport system permease component
VSGWTVAIGIPIEELRAHLWFSLARLFVAGFIAVLVGMGIALLFGRRLVR